MPRLRDDKFFNLDRDGLRFKLQQNGGSDVGCEFFDELPLAALTEFQQPLGDGEVINRVGNRIAFGGGGKIRFHFHRQQQTLRLGALRIRHADAVKYFEVNNGDLRHLRFTIYDFGFQNGLQQNLRRLVQLQFFRLDQFEPAKFAAFLVQFHGGLFGGATAGVIQQHKMRVLVKFLRVDAV